MEVREIEIDKIIEMGNVRQRLEEKDVHELMESIKQDGLLEPIGVVTRGDKYGLIYGKRRKVACKKLGWKFITAVILDDIEAKDIIIKNTVENIQREDVSIIEQGRIFSLLQKKHDMTISELASRFGIAKTSVGKSISLFEKLPEEMAKDVRKFKIRGDKKGKIPYSTAYAIITKGTRLKLSDAKIQTLIRASSKDWFSKAHIDPTFFFLSRGYDLEESFKMAKKYIFISAKMPIDREELKRKMDKHNILYKREFLRKILTGEIKEKLSIPEWADDNEK